MTKYISDVQTVEDEGTTGIRITVSEDIGETTIRAVNTKEFETMQTAIEKLQKDGIDTTKLEQYLKNYAKLTDLNNYAKTTELDNYEPINERLWVARIKKKSDGNWDYSTLAGMYGSYIRFNLSDSVGHGFCLIVRAGGYSSSDIGNTIPIFVQQYNEGSPFNANYGDRTTYEQTLTITTPDGDSSTEKCLVCPVNLDTNGATTTRHGTMIYNYKGRTITRLWSCVE